MSTDEVTVKRTEHDNGVVYTFSGELDSFGTKHINPDFSQQIAHDRSKYVVVDLSGVRFVASAALAMFIAHAQSMARGGGKMVVAAASDQARGVFDLSGFASVIPMYEDVEAALADAAHA